MSRFPALMVAFCGLCVAQAPDEGVPASSNVLNAQYPRVHSDLRVTFRVSAPNAQKVQVQPGGTDNGLGKGPFDMVKDEKGVWTVTIPPAVPGFHYYWFVVDGFPANDPASETYFGWAKPTSGIEIPEKGADFYEFKDVAHGEVRVRPYFSKVTGQWRQAYVYTPPGYDRGSARYPVLYLQHGSGENGTGWSRQGRANLILDNLLAAGKAKPMLVVMETGYGTKPGQAGNAFEDVLVNDLIPMVDGAYRTQTGRESRAMAGLSMGGGQTLQITAKHLDKFAWIGAFSAPMRNFDAKTAYNGVFADAEAYNKRVKLLWIGAGTAEQAMYQGAKATKAGLDQAGIKSVFFESPGTAHEWQTWRRSLADFAARLF